MDDELEIDGASLEEGTLLVLEFVFAWELFRPIAKPAPTPMANEATIEIMIGSFFMLSPPIIYLINIRKKYLKAFGSFLTIFFSGLFRHKMAISIFKTNLKIHNKKPES